MTCVDYAPKPNAAERTRRWATRVAWYVFGVVAVCSAWWYLPQVRFLMAQRRCLQSQLPASSVVLELIPRSLVDDQLAPQPSGPGYAEAPPDVLNQVPGSQWRANYRSAVFNPADLRATIPKTEVVADAVVFCHERRSPGGRRRLIVVDAGLYVPPVSLPGEAEVDIVGARVCDLATWRPGSRPRTIDDGTLVDGWSNVRGDAPWAIRIYAGQPDELDASHFTIRVDSRRAGEPSWVTYTWDGWLGDDDVVRWHRKDPLAGVEFNSDFSRGTHRIVAK